MHSWQLSGIDHQPFEALFETSDDALAAQGIVR